MSRILIVGGSKGIGRDVRPFLLEAGYEVSVVPRGELPTTPCVGLFLCQRYRGPDEWDGEMETSLTYTKDLLEWVSLNAHDYARGCSVVAMSSVAAVSVEDEQPVSYHVAKAGIEAMVRCYAKTLGPKGIRVNAIRPGLTIKPEARPFYDAHPELESLYKRITPMGCTCTVEHIALELINLLDPRCGKTGTVSVVDQGTSLASHWNQARKQEQGLRDLSVRQKVVA